MREQGRGMVLLFAVIAMACGSLFAFQPIPKESAKALKITRGKPFSSGAVFINGKYIAPPYTVERWGTGVRINSIQVTGQIVDWTEFLKTQDGVKVEKTVAAPQEEARPEPVPEPVSEDTETSALDALFDDAPPAVSARKPSAAPAPKKAAPAPKASATYSMSGEFVLNADSKALLKRVNDARTEIDRILRAGGFICFGDRYSRVTGDRRTLMMMFDALPEIQQRAESVEDFCARVRAARLVYLNEVLCEDLFKNRIDYRKIKERRTRYRSDRQWDQILDEANDAIL